MPLLLRRFSLRLFARRPFEPGETGGSRQRARNPPPPGVRDDFWDAVTRGQSPMTAEQRRRAEPSAPRPRGRPPGSRNKARRQNPFDVAEARGANLGTTRFEGKWVRNPRRPGQKGDPGWSPTEHPRDRSGRFVTSGRTRARPSRAMSPAERRARRLRPRGPAASTLLDYAGNLLGLQRGGIPAVFPGGQNIRENLRWYYRIQLQNDRIRGPDMRALRDQGNLYGRLVNSGLEMRHSSRRALERNFERHVARVDRAISLSKSPGDAVVYARLPTGATRRGHALHYPGYVSGTNTRVRHGDQLRIQVKEGQRLGVYVTGGRRLDIPEVMDLARHFIPQSILNQARVPVNNFVFPRGSYFRIYRTYDNGEHVTHYAVVVTPAEARALARHPTPARRAEPVRDPPFRTGVRDIDDIFDGIWRGSDPLPTSGEAQALEFARNRSLDGGAWNSILHPRDASGRFARGAARSLLQRTGRALFNPESAAAISRMGFSFNGHVSVEPEASSKAERRHILNTLKVVFGGRVPTRREVARVIGAPDGSHIRLTSSEYKLSGQHIRGVSLNFYHPSFEDTGRTIMHDSVSGRRQMLNSLMFLTRPSVEPRGGFTSDEIMRGMRPAALGTRLFAQQVRQARASGISRIVTSAHSDTTGSNGAFSWARMGYNGYVPLDRIPNSHAIPPSVRQRTHARTGERFVTIHDVMSTPAGVAWWRTASTNQNFSWWGTFNTSARSRHSRYLDEYLKARGIRLD